MALRAIGTKSIAQPDNTAGVERDHIEAARRQNAPPCHQIVLRGEDQPPLLMRANTRGRRRELPASPRPHFDKNERPAAPDLAHHEIDLAPATRKISRYHVQSLTLQVLERALLERVSDCLRHIALPKVVPPMRGTMTFPAPFPA